jgi:MFS family permease
VPPRRRRVTWAVAALFLSVVPSYASELLDSSNLALLGLIAATMLAASCVAQVLLRGRLPRRPLAIGCALLVAGLAALVLAFPEHSLVLLLLAGFLAGAGHGYAFLGAQSDVNALVPDERRGELSSAFFCCIYAGVAVSVIGVGLLGERVALSTAVDVFAAVMAVGAIGVAIWELRGRVAWQPEWTQHRS